MTKRKRVQVAEPSYMTLGSYVYLGKGVKKSTSATLATKLVSKFPGETEYQVSSTLGINQIFQHYKEKKNGQESR